MSKERVLVIGAHCDDESFGCLGTLLKHKEAGDKIFFLWWSHGRNTLEGAKQCAKYFSAWFKYLHFPDQELDTYPFSTLTDILEGRIAEIKPTIVYTNFIGDLNKDHRLIAEATMVACRPYLPNAPKEVWMYPIKGTTELGLREFKVDKSIAIDPFKKAELLKLWYPDELKSGREDVGLFELFERWPMPSI